MNKLTGKVAAVTGSASGIGKATALLMAEEGAKVILGDINRDGVDQTAKSITDKGGSAIAVYSDISTMAGAEALIKAAVGDFGRIDILINTAGFTRTPETLEDTEKNWDDIVGLNLKGPFNTMHFAIPEMVKQKGGSIINFGSRAGFFDFIPEGLPEGSMPYSAAKAGIIGLTSIASLNLKKHGIRVNAVIPSAMTSGFPEIRPKFGGGETKGPEYVAPVVVYLATDAAKEITNKYFYVCSGDVIALEHPFRLREMNKTLAKDGIWTIEELSEKMTLDWMN